MEINEKQLKKMIHEAIEKSVNGKINDIHKEVKAQNKELNKHMNKIEPFIDGFNAAKTVTHWIKWTAGFIIAISAAILAIKKLFFN